MFAINILALAGLAAASVMPGSYQAGPIMRRANDTVVTTTKVVAHYTTYCPEPTIFSLGTKTYTVTEPTTLTITDCPCTIVEVSSYIYIYTYIYFVLFLQGERS